jgi:ABC-type transport system involved in cytochrome bd biosynthesis fused ATPase/permease subunit
MVAVMAVVITTTVATAMVATVPAMVVTVLVMVVTVLVMVVALTAHPMAHRSSRLRLPHLPSKIPGYIAGKRGLIEPPFFEVL